ncbi:ankyrin repeat domain-containing protein [Rickettsiales bacterium]|nr:ankyrin repeat domain-containing protein [Rickettsiales bacterium]
MSISKININEKDEFGRTPLISSVVEGNLENIKTLINKGADLNAVDEEGRTALMIASITGNAEIVKLIVKSLDDAEKKENEYDINFISYLIHGVSYFFSKILGKKKLY